MQTYFDHDRVSLAFNEWVGEFLSSISAKAAAKDQLDRAATSIPLNIAEGNGKFSKRDRARFFDASGLFVREDASGEFLSEQEQEKE